MTLEAEAVMDKRTDFLLQELVKSRDFKDQVHIGQIASNDLLDKRDVTILLLLAQGYSQSQIGGAIYYAEDTVRKLLADNSHSRRRLGLYGKLGVNGAFEAIAWSLENGVIKPESIVPEDYELRLTSLSPKEREAFDISVQIRKKGQLKAIGDTVFLRPRTVKNYLITVTEKLHARNNVHAKAMHMAYGMMQASQRIS